MSMGRVFFCTSRDIVARAARYITSEMPEGWMVICKPKTRTMDQNAKFHALCYDIEKSRVMWAGKLRTAAQWKVLLVSGHAIATGEGADVVPGLEGEFINIRESTAAMDRTRASSLIEYTLAFCAQHHIDLNGE